MIARYNNWQSLEIRVKWCYSFYTDIWYQSYIIFKFRTRPYENWCFPVERCSLANSCVWKQPQINGNIHSNQNTFSKYYYVQFICLSFPIFFYSWEKHEVRENRIHNVTNRTSSKNVNHSIWFSPFLVMSCITGNWHF